MAFSNGDDSKQVNIESLFLKESMTRLGKRENFVKENSVANKLA